MIKSEIVRVREWVLPFSLVFVPTAYPTMHSCPSSTPDRIPNLGAVVLCGGHSSRMGVDKASLLFQQRTFLDHLIERVGTVAAPIVVVGGDRSILKERLPHVIFATDKYLDCGPLEGIRVGLDQLSGQVEFAFVTGCDAPLIRPSVIARLFQLIGDHQAIMPKTGAQIYGLTSIYRTDIVGLIEAEIQAGRLRVKGLAEILRTKLLDGEELRSLDPQLDSLRNINTPHDYQQLLQRLDETSTEH